MAWSEFELKRFERLVQASLEKRRPPPSERAQFDLGFRIAGQSIELFEIRPDWREPQVIRERSFAKTTYVKTKAKWRIFWMRADLKWHSYQPAAEVDRLEDFLAVVEADPHHCFWG